MLPLEHSAILLTCIKRLLVFKTNFRSFGEWPFYTGFTVDCKQALKYSMFTYRSSCPSKRSGSVVECLTSDRGAAGSSLTGVTALCP